MPDSSGDHLGLHSLVGFLIEGSPLTPKWRGHLAGCPQCRDSLVVIALEEIERECPAAGCQIRERLFREWGDAAEMYVKTLAELAGNINVAPESELLTLGRIAEVARKLTANVRIELEEHITNHRCR